MTIAAELQAWLNGVPDGGPHGDGRYPLTYADGQTYLVYCPAAQALNPTLEEQPIEVFANTASAAATTATAAASEASSARLDAVTAAANAQSYANAANTHRANAQTAANTANTRANTATSAASTATDAASTATSAQSAAETARNKAQDWADKAEDSPVESGRFSARHWALKAAASAAALATLAWDMVQNKPATATRWPTWGEVTGKPSIPSSSDYVATSGNQSGLSGNKTWTGNHTFTSSSNNDSLTVARSGSTTRNAYVTYSTSATTIYAGIANVNDTTWGIGSNANLTSNNTPFQFDVSTGAFSASGSISDSGGNLRTAIDGKVGTSRTITAGNGLSGGGSLASNRTITLGTPSAITAESTNDVTSSSHTHSLDLRHTLATATATAPTGVTVSDTYGVSGLSGSVALTGWFNTARAMQILTSNSGGTATPRAWFRTYHSSGGGGGWTSEFEFYHTGNLTPSNYALASRTISAGNGLTGGGSLSANRTITLGTPGTITSTSTNSVTSTGHTHNLDTTGNFTWTGNHTFIGDMIARSGSASRQLTIQRTGNSINAAAAYTTTGSTIYAGQGDDGYFAWGTNTDLRYSHANTWGRIGAGGLEVKGTVTTGQRLYVGNVGQLRSNSNSHLVISAAGGTVYLRPNGDGSSSGQFTVNTSGNAVVTGSLTVGGTRVPKVFVQSGDPGSNASTGDLWIW